MTIANTKRPPRKAGDVRLATFSDRAELLRLIKAYYRFDSIKFDSRKTPLALDRLLRSTRLGRAWVMERGGKLAGYAIMTWNYDLEFDGLEGIITDFFIVARYRSKGLGRELMAAIAGFCRRKGVSAIELQVTKGNRRALAFYSSLGFERLERTVMSLDVTRFSKPSMQVG